ncbi:hypothetical protein A9Q84_02860 [Halobacteriovorax marinus]|uniref:ATP-grasp domain-containing protein n=1 Tax=Halobacteriovorax marinus TaxID=97084 RepID=A0A1Y5FD15_9BACT|nr:hypothetical protein A9Q84_02860 [Halobacteriovorax marinus]
MKVLVISQNSQLYSSSRLLQEAKQLDLPCRHVNIYETGHWSELESSDASVVFNRYSGIKYDDFDLQLCQSWKNQGALILNPVDETLTFRDKLSSHIFMNNLEVACSPTRAIRGDIPIELLEDIINFPKSDCFYEDEYIIKPTRSNKGYGISLCRGFDSLQSQLESYYYLKDQRFIIQPRIKGIREYRLFFVGQNIVGAFEKNGIHQNEFRLNANRSECFKIEPRDLSEGILSFFHEIRRNTNLFYGGIDLIETNDNLFLLEVNPCPGFETLEKVCEVNVAKELIDHVRNSFSN